MRKIWLLCIFALLIPAIGFGQEQIINSFDTAPADTNYWAWFETVNTTSTFGGHFNTSDNADSALGWITVDYITDIVTEGTGAMKIDWSAHNIESWGGYSKLEHMHPDSNSVYDFSAYDSLMFWYYNETPQSLTGRVNFRLNLHDVSDSENGNKTYNIQELEYYYSFHYILDNAPGWNKIVMPLKDGRFEPTLDEWGGGAFNRTGWSGISGNDELDLDKIKGFSMEFSVSGAGDGDHVTGTFIIDHLTLFSPTAVELIFFNGRDLPGNVGLWGGWGGGSYEITDEEAFTEGTNSIKWNTPPNDWAVWDGLVFTLTSPKNLGFSWQTDSLKVKIKAEAGLGAIKFVLADPDEDGDGADLEFEAGYLLEESAVGKALDYDGTWKSLSIALKDFNRFDGGWDGTQTQPGEMDSTKVKFFKILIASTAAVGKVVYLDEIWTGNPEIDIIPPAAPSGVNAIAGDFYNLVIWEDVPGESEESYNVYASRDPITDLTSRSVDLIASGVGENNQTATHWIYYPLADTDVGYYYAVVCKDGAGNASETFGTPSGVTTNTAKGIATISLNPPENFVADGDLSEWDASGIMPFVITPEDNHVPVGTVTNSSDLKGTVYMAIDDSYLYIAVDVIDDVYNFGAGNWWDQDAFQLFVGLYDQRGVTHTSIKRGEEPDYIIYCNEENIVRDYTDGGSLYVPADPDYYFSDLGGVDYVVEVRIPLDSLVVQNDERFHPVRGMRIPLDLYFHDNDGVWDGNLGFSPNSTDLQWQSPAEWAYTWIGDTTDVMTGVDELVDGNIIRTYSLEQNYPNPFNPYTTIEYTLAKAGNVKIELFNVLGQKVMTLVDERKTVGRYSIQLNASDLSSGLYFYTIQAGEFVHIRKMILMK